MAALRRVRGPDRTGDIVTLGLVRELAIDGGSVRVVIAVPAGRRRTLEPLRLAVEKAVRAVAGVSAVAAALVEQTADRAGPASAAPPAARGGTADIGHIVAIASGKGGVGKSTTAVNLALALGAEGLAVGLLDADIHGPSLPRMMHLTTAARMAGGGAMQPQSAYGLVVMSMGCLVDEDTPMIWRGAMAAASIRQLVHEVAWGRLDVLLIDLPPGTGDVQLALAQEMALSGAVIVSTPQDLALIDARRAMAMFGEVAVPVLGLIENMSGFVCPSCGAASSPFGGGGVADEARRVDLPLFGRIPLDIDIRKHADSGTPILAANPDGAAAGAYRSIARHLRDALPQPTADPARRRPRLLMDD